MRRLTTKNPTEKSAVKKQQEELVASIASDKGVKEALEKEAASLKSTIKKAEKEAAELEAKVEFWKKATVDAEMIFKDWEGKAKEAHAQIAAAEIRIKELGREETIARTNLSRMQVESAGEMAQIHNQVEAKKKEIDAAFVAMMNENTQLENRVGVLRDTETSIISEITTKQAVLTSLDGKIEKAEADLKHINLNLTSARAAFIKAEKEIIAFDSRLETLKLELSAQDKEILEKKTALEEQETSLLQKKEQMLALGAKEQRIAELIPAIQELYRNAGLSVKI